MLDRIDKKIIVLTWDFQSRIKRSTWYCHSAVNDLL